VPGATPSDPPIVGVPNGYSFELWLQWDEPWGNATTDLNIELVDAATGNPLTRDVTNNVGGNPVAGVYWRNNTGNLVDVALEITRANGTGTPRMKYIAYQRDQNGVNVPFFINEYDTVSSAISPDAASARGALTVAEVRLDIPGLNTPQAESSRGPVTHYFDAAVNRLATPEVRQKPDVAGATCVSTTVPGFATFCGTSAAAPHIAGIAALMLSANPNLTVQDLYAVMRQYDPNPAISNTIDCTNSSPQYPRDTFGNPHNACGYGFVLADHAVADVLATHMLTVQTSGLGSNTTTISNDGTVLGTASDAAPLKVSLDVGTPLDLKASPIVTGSDGTQYYFQGFSPPPPGTLTADVTTTAGYESVAQAIAKFRAQVRAGQLAQALKDLQTFYRNVQADLQQAEQAGTLSNPAHTRQDLQSTICQIQGQAGKQLAASLLKEATGIDRQLGGNGSLPRC
jgi:subtilisin family serine protease